VEGLGWVLCGCYTAVLVGVVGLIGETEKEEGGKVAMGMVYGLDGMYNVDARLALDGCLEKMWVVLHYIWQGVVAFSHHEGIWHSKGAGICFNRVCYPSTVHPSYSDVSKPW